MSPFYKAGARCGATVTPMRTAEGPFSITMTGEPPFDEQHGISLARARFEKRFSGPLEATSVVHFLSARTTVANSAGYVALERISGTLEGRAGSFVALHLGLMDRGSDSLRIELVPDSATGDLRGLRGTMTIRIVDRQHFYRLDYELG